jgi:hypothetical protein
VVLRLSVAAALSCRAKVSDTPPALAVSVADSVEFAGETVAVKLALLAPAATLTEDGTLTNELLLDKLTVNPPLAAAAFSVTAQLSVPDPVIELLVQFSALSTGTPVPLRLTLTGDPVNELLVSVS